MWHSDQAGLKGQNLGAGIFPVTSEIAKYFLCFQQFRTSPWR